MYRCIPFIAALLISTISLAAKKMLTFDHTHTISNSFYDHLQVIDMRAKNAVIGSVAVSPLYIAHKLVTDKPLDTTLSEYFDKLITAPRAHNRLVLLLYHFKVESLQDGSKDSYIHFDGDFYRTDGTGYFYLGNSNVFIDKTNVTARRLLTVTQHTVRNIFAGAANGLANNTDSTKYSMQTMLARRDSIKHSFPIYNTTQFKKGIYATVDQFLNNEPLDTPFTTVYLSESEKIHHFRYYYTDKDGSKGPRIDESSYFVIYDGDRWAISSKLFGVEVQYINSDFYTILMLMAGRGNRAMARTYGVSEKKIKRHIALSPAYYESIFNPSYKSFIRLNRINQ